MQVDVRHSPKLENALDLPAAVERAVLAVAQEGCTNALRHAPSAPIHLRLRTEADGVELEVENGAPEDKVMLPAAPQGTGRGLAGLSTQVEALGGELTAGPQGDGWRLRARVPLRPAVRIDEARTTLFRKQRQMRRKLILVPAAVAAVLLALPIAAVLGQAALSSLPPAKFANIAVGQPQTVAEAQLPRLEMEAPPAQVGGATVGTTSRRSAPSTAQTCTRCASRTDMSPRPQRSQRHDAPSDGL